MLLSDLRRKKDQGTSSSPRTTFLPYLSKLSEYTNHSIKDKTMMWLRVCTFSLLLLQSVTSAQQGVPRENNLRRMMEEGDMTANQIGENLPGIIIRDPECPCPCLDEEFNPGYVLSSFGINFCLDVQAAKRLLRIVPIRRFGCAANLPNGCPSPIDWNYQPFPTAPPINFPP